MTIAIRAMDLSKRYGRATAVDQLTLEIEEGSVYALIGPNGAGKTTTIRMLMNITRPTSGRAEVLGRDARTLTGAALDTIGYVSENQTMPDWMTVGDLMTYLAPFYPTWDPMRASSLVDGLHLPRDRKLKHLSRGMRMKAALASSLAYSPKLLVLEEPFSGLDPLARDEYVEGLVEHAQGLTILISSHELMEIETFASHVGYLESGRLLWSESIASLADRFRNVDVTLDKPVPGPDKWPDGWLQPELAPSVLRFVDSRFDENRTAATVRSLCGDGARLTTWPMTLRDVFLAMARAGREHR